MSPVFPVIPMSFHFLKKKKGESEMRVFFVQTNPIHSQQPRIPPPQESFDKLVFLTSSGALGGTGASVLGDSLAPPISDLPGRMYTSARSFIELSITSLSPREMPDSSSRWDSSTCSLLLSSTPPLLYVSIKESSSFEPVQQKNKKQKC